MCIGRECHNYTAAADDDETLAIFSFHTRTGSYSRRDSTRKWSTKI